MPLSSLVTKPPPWVVSANSACLRTPAAKDNQFNELCVITLILNYINMEDFNDV